MALALRFLAALLPLKSRYDVSPIDDPSLGVTCLLQISNLFCGTELAKSQLAEGNPLSRPEQSSEGGSDRSDDPTQLKPKGESWKKA